MLLFFSKLVTVVKVVLVLLSFLMCFYLNTVLSIVCNPLVSPDLKLCLFLLSVAFSIQFCFIGRSEFFFALKFIYKILSLPIYLSIFGFLVYLVYLDSIAYSPVIFSFSLFTVVKNTWTLVQKQKFFVEFQKEIPNYTFTDYEKEQLLRGSFNPADLKEKMVMMAQEKTAVQSHWTDIFYSVGSKIHEMDLSDWVVAGCIGLCVVGFACFIYSQITFEPGAAGTIVPEQSVVSVAVEPKLEVETIVVSAHPVVDVVTEPVVVVGAEVAVLAQPVVQEIEETNEETRDRILAQESDLLEARKAAREARKAAREVTEKEVQVVWPFKRTAGTRLTEDQKNQLFLFKTDARVAAAHKRQEVIDSSSCSKLSDDSWKSAIIKSIKLNPKKYTGYSIWKDWD